MSNVDTYGNLYSEYIAERLNYFNDSPYFLESKPNQSRFNSTLITASSPLYPIKKIFTEVNIVSFLEVLSIYIDFENDWRNYDASKCALDILFKVHTQYHELHREFSITQSQYKEVIKKCKKWVRELEKEDNEIIYNYLGNMALYDSELDYKCINIPNMSSLFQSLKRNSAFNLFICLGAIIDYMEIIDEFLIKHSTEEKGINRVLSNLFGFKKDSHYWFEKAGIDKVYFKNLNLGLIPKSDLDIYMKQTETSITDSVLNWVVPILLYNGYNMKTAKKLKDELDSEANKITPYISELISFNDSYVRLASISLEERYEGCLNLSKTVEPLVLMQS
jgi:hypothetical protein